MTLLSVLLLTFAPWADCAESPLIATWKGHVDKVANVAFTGDGKRALSVSDDSTARLWDVTTGKTLAIYRGGDRGVIGMVYFSDGDKVVTGDMALTLWEAASMKKILTFAGHDALARKLVLSEINGRAATTSWDGELKLWDLSSGAELFTLHPARKAPINDIAFSPDGRLLLAAGGDKSVHLWEVASGKRLDLWSGHQGSVLSVAFSPDGSKAVTGAGDNTLRLWETASGRTLAVWRGHTSYVYRVAFSPDGRVVLSGGADYTVKKWDVATGKNVATWWGHQGAVLDIAFSPDGARALSTSEDSTLKLWDVSGDTPRIEEEKTADLPPPDTPENLGKMLYFDARLSGDNSRSCAVCHDPRKAFADGIALSVGYPDTLYFRNTPSLFNSASQESLYWDGRFPAGDMISLIRDHISEAHFMQADGRLIVEKLRQTEGYVKAFEKIYGEEPSYARILESLSAFVRTIRSGESAFDRYLRGDKDAISRRAQRGWELFEGKGGCAKCHSGPLLTDGTFHDRSVPENPEIFRDPFRHIAFRRFFKLLGIAQYPDLRRDLGYYALTKSEADRGKFRTPSLREAARTAPYMHNGMLMTLQDAVASENPQLSRGERDAIVEFLKTLSSETPIVEPPPLPTYILRPRRAREDSPPDASPLPEAVQDFPPLSPLPAVPVPADNPTTPVKVELGKLLFFDQRLSGNGDNFCGSCHEPAMGWGDNSDIAQGYTETLHWRNSQTLLNAAYYSRLNWDGSRSSLEEQARAAIESNISSNGDPAMIEERLAQSPRYTALFKEAFGGARPHYEGVLQALAAFQRAVPLSRNVPFDAYARGDAAALSPSAVNGLKLFEGKAGCIRCHNGPLASDQKFYATGVPRNPAFDNVALRQVAIRYEHVLHGVPEDVYRVADSDPGLYFATQRAEDIGKFRTPSLRELKFTAPYMHNGIFLTLADVVEFYNRGAGTSLLRPLDLSADEKQDLLAFLESLSGDPVLLDRPDQPDPYYGEDAQ